MIVVSKNYQNWKRKNSSIKFKLLDPVSCLCLWKTFCECIAIKNIIVGVDFGVFHLPIFPCFHAIKWKKKWSASIYRRTLFAHTRHAVARSVLCFATILEDDTEISTHAFAILGTVDLDFSQWGETIARQCLLVMIVPRAVRDEGMRSCPREQGTLQEQRR